MQARNLLLIVLISLFACKGGDKGAHHNDHSSDSLVAEKDTFLISHYRFYIQPASAGEYDNKYIRSFEGTEEEHLKQDAAKVRRQGLKLLFKCRNGREAVLENRLTEGEDHVEYEYLGQLHDESYYVVSANFYEWYNYFLINQANGDTVVLRGLPILSPNGKMILSGNADLFAGFTDNGYELYRVTNDGLMLLGTRELLTWGPEATYWQNDSELMVQRIVIDTLAPNSERKEFIRMKMRNE